MSDTTKGSGLEIAKRVKSQPVFFSFGLNHFAKVHFVAFMYLVHLGWHCPIPSELGQVNKSHMDSGSPQKCHPVRIRDFGGGEGSHTCLPFSACCWAWWMAWILQRSCAIFQEGRKCVPWPIILRGFSPVLRFTGLYQSFQAWITVDCQCLST